MKGKQVLLTGGTGGLGLGVTPAVLARGAVVTIPYQRETNLQRLKNKLPAADFARIRFVKADLYGESVVEQLVNDLGRVDLTLPALKRRGFASSPIMDSYRRSQSATTDSFKT